MDADFRNFDMPKIIAALLFFVGEQEKANITYSVEDAGETKTA